MISHYRILLPVHDFEKGETHPADRFPIGTDFERLIKLGVVHPNDGSPIPVSENDAAGWKERALAAESEIELLRSKSGAQLAKEEKDRFLGEIERLNKRVDELQREGEGAKAEFVRKLGLMGDPGAALSVALAERDAARNEVAKLKGSGETQGELETETEAVAVIPVTAPIPGDIDPNVLSAIMNGFDVPMLDAKIQELDIKIDPTANKRAKAIALVSAGFTGV